MIQNIKQYKHCMSHIILVILCPLLLTSCFLSSKQMIEHDAEKRRCIPVSRAFQVPPRDCPKSIYPDTNRYNSCETAPDAMYKIGGSTPAAWLVIEARRLLTTASQELYEALASDNSIGVVIKGLSTLVLIFYALATMTGIIPVNAYSFFMTIMKIALVTIFALNWGEFHQWVIIPIDGDPDIAGADVGLIDYIIYHATPVLSYSYTGATVSKTVDSTVFFELDKVIATFFHWNFMKLLMALVFTGLSGLFYAFLLGFMVFTYVWAVIAAIQTYLIALIGRFLLYATAPVFIIAALFNHTRVIFSGWLEQLISFILQPILLMLVLFLYHQLIYDMAISNIVSGDDRLPICYDKRWELAGFLDIYWWQLGDAGRTTANPSGYNPDIPINGWSIFAAIILSYILIRMAEWSVTIAQTMSSGLVSSYGMYLGGYSSRRAQQQAAYAALNVAMSPVAGAVGATRGLVFGSRDRQGNRTRGGIGGAYHGARRGVTGMFTSASSRMETANQVEGLGRPKSRYTFTSSAPAHKK